MEPFSQSFPLADPPAAQPQDWFSPPPADSDPVIRASQYLRLVRQRAIQPDWIVMANPEDQHLTVLTWIGQHIHEINQQLHGILIELLACLQPQDRPSVEIFAAPIAPKLGIDGFCNLQTHPITLIVDPSRVIPADWPHLVAHELTHATAHGAGHGPRFYQVLSSLCLAQDLPIPPPDSLNRGVLPYWPPCRSNPQAEPFWLGTVDRGQTEESP